MTASRPQLSFALKAIQDARDTLASVESYSLRDILERSPGFRAGLYDELGTTVHNFLARYGSLDTFALDAIAGGSVAFHLEQGGALTITNPPDSPADMYSQMSQDLQGACWVRDQVLEENDVLRRRIVELERENRMWKLSAVMGWATIPYPRLRPEDFDDLERQP